MALIHVGLMDMELPSFYVFSHAHHDLKAQAFLLTQVEFEFKTANDLFQIN